MTDQTTGPARVEGLEPYHVTEWCQSSAECDYCAEGWDLAEKHRHKFYVQRAGASNRTADELAQVFLFDVAAIVTTYNVPEELAALELESGIPGSGWCDDPDMSQALADEIGTAESALCDVGLSSYWDDGYVIESVELETEVGCDDC